MTALLASLPASEIRNAVLVALAFVSLIGVAELWHRLAAPPVEWTRKLVHFAGGCVCLALPALVRWPGTVLILGIGMCLLFVISKKQEWLQSIHGIDRPSHGTEFYPLVIFLLFAFSVDQYWKYIICVLVLAVSDSAAALIGTRFGKLRFTVEDETKSLEGSLAFYLVTLLVVLVPLLIWQPLHGHPDAVTHYVLASTLIAALVTCMEIVSLSGTDNLWVPLGTWLVLTKTFQTDVSDLWIQNLSFLVLLGCLLVVARASAVLNAGGTLVCCLAAYGLWAMGSLDWAMVFFIAMGFYLLVAWLVQTPWEVRVRVAACSLLPPVLILAAANVLLNTGNPDGYHLLFGPFLAASCVSLGQAIANQIAWRFRRRARLRMAVAMATSLIVTLSMVGASMIRQAIRDVPGLIALCLIATVLVVTSTRVLPTLPPRDAPRGWLHIRAALAMLAAVLVFLLQQLGIGTDWHPA